MVRGNSIQYSSRKKRSNNNTLQALQSRLERLERHFQNEHTDDIFRDINLIKTDINDILQEQVNGSIMRTKMKWVEYGEKRRSFSWV